MPKWSLTITKDGTTVEARTDLTTKPVATANCVTWTELDGTEITYPIGPGYKVAIKQTAT